MDWTEQQAEREKKRAEWLAGLKVGDEVAIPIGSWTRSYEIRRVVGLTPTRIRVEGRPTLLEVDRETGQIRRSRLSGRSHRSQIEPVTPEMKEGLARADLLTRIAVMRREDWELLATKDLQGIVSKVILARRGGA